MMKHCVVYFCKDPLEVTYQRVSRKPAEKQMAENRLREQAKRNESQERCQIA